MTAGDLNGESKNPEGPDASLSPQPAPSYIHSDIYDRLVEAPDDFVGIVAYGIYQQRKRGWIADCEKRDGSPPSDAARKDYSFSYREADLIALREEARNKLFRFSNEIVNSQMPDLQRRAFNQRTVDEVSQYKRDVVSWRSEIMEEVRSLKATLHERTGYGHHIKTHVAGFICLAALIALLTLASNYETSPKEAAKSLIEKLIGQKEAQQ